MASYRLTLNEEDMEALRALLSALDKHGLTVEVEGDMEEAGVEVPADAVVRLKEVVEEV